MPSCEGRPAELAISDCENLCGTGQYSYLFAARVAGLEAFLAAAVLEGAFLAIVFFADALTEALPFSLDEILLLATFGARTFFADVLALD
jgi:hypothetical protein